MARPRIKPNQVDTAGSAGGQIFANVGGVGAWSDAAGKMDSIPSGIVTTQPKSWVSDGDANGVFYFLGTALGTLPWINPVTRGMTAVRSTNFNGVAANLFDRVTNVTNTNDALPQGFIFVDLGAGRSLLPSRYAAQATSGLFMRSWKLQGTNSVVGTSVGQIDAATWTDLDVQVSNTTYNAAYSWASFVPNQPNTTAYRYFRIVITGLNASGGWQMSFSEWELYGQFTYTANAVTPFRILAVEGVSGGKVQQTPWSAIGGALAVEDNIAVSTTLANGNISLTPNGTGVLNLNRAVIPNFTPASATATGVQGQITRDANFIYICTATNTWKRVAITTW